MITCQLISDIMTFGKVHATLASAGPNVCGAFGLQQTTQSRSRDPISPHSIPIFVHSSLPNFTATRTNLRYTPACSGNITRLHPVSTQTANVRRPSGVVKWRHQNVLKYLINLQAAIKRDGPEGFRAVNIHSLREIVFFYCRVTCHGPWAVAPKRIWKWRKGPGTRQARADGERLWGLLTYWRLIS